MSTEATISVVIPTLNRPALLLRALDSVFAQTLQPLEIVVVLDGSQEETLTALKRVGRDSLQVIVLEKRSGAPVARNEGVKAARGAWIAFLDDDDEWLPRKLEAQMEAALGSTWKYPIVCSSVFIRNPDGDFLCPRRKPAKDERIDDYLFCRQTLLPREVFLQTSNWLVPRSLLSQVNFRSEQRKWQDTDWLLRASQISGTGLEFVSEPLSIWYADDGTRPTITTSLDWRYLFDWAVSNPHLFSPRSYAGVLLIGVAREALGQGKRRAMLTLFAEALRNGKPNSIQLISFLLTLIAPRRFRGSNRLLRPPRRNSPTPSVRVP